jgi:16S rRNA (cytidine1402-2'-O)-methyltransferase
VPANDRLEPGLHVVATPIGNLGDLAPRAADTLRRADRILVEDTRVTAKLLRHIGAKVPMQRYDDHSSDAERARIVEQLGDQAIALVSDAGTPLISDPGYKLVREAAAAGHRVIPIPGASATLAALAIAGLPTDRFLFAGFLPPKSGPRRAMLEELAGVRATLVFYETGPRLADSLADMAAVLGAVREAAVARELTKLYETCIRGSLETLAADPRLAAPRGEIVVLVGPGREEAATAEDTDAALGEALTRLSPAEAAAQVAKALGLNRRDLYRRAVELKGGG